MCRIYKFLVVATFLALAGIPAQAASIAAQITSALAKGDYKTVQVLASGNADATGHAEGALLKDVYGKLTPKPQDAAQSMTVAAALASGIAPKNAKSVTEDLKKIVKAIADKKLLVCNPEADADTSKIEAATDPRKIADEQAIVSILDSALAIAQTPAIVAVDPDLFNQIQALSAQCETGEEALLAQRPMFRRQTILPHLQNPVTPQHPASPD
ncbi:MAG: hypothetical protein PHY92_10340 [Alphaproteobacteria bacterium]|nr:hypothetical protein [Alphaproteobacteria bacterium]